MGSKWPHLQVFKSLQNLNVRRRALSLLICSVSVVDEAKINVQKKSIVT